MASTPAPLFTASSKITGISYYGTQLYYTTGSCMYSYSTGVSTIVAGIRSLSAQTADGAYPTTTALVNTVALCTDMNGNRYIIDKSGSDNTKSVIVKMPSYTPLQAGLTYNLAGTNACDSGVNTCVGTFTNNQPAYSETFGAIKGMCYDSVGNLYVCDAAQHIVAIMGATGTMSVYAGMLGQAGSSGDGAAATSARLSSPSDIKMSRGNILYIADTGNNKIRRVKLSMLGTIIETLSFTGLSITSPKCLAFDANENLYVVGDALGKTIYRISNFGIAATIYTSLTPITCITVDRATNTLYFSTPTDVWRLVTGTPVLVLSGLTAANGLAIDSTNNLYVSDSTTNKVFRTALPVASVNAMNISSMTAYIGNGEQEPSFSITNSVAPNIYGNAGPPTTRALTSPGAIVVNPSQGILVAQPSKVTLLATTSAAALPSCANKISHISIRNISITETMYLSQIVALNSSGVNVLLQNPYISTGTNSTYASYTDGTYACKSKDAAYAILPKMTLTIPISPPDDIVIVLVYPSSTNKVNWNGATIRTTPFPVGSSNNPVRIIQGVSESPGIKNFVIDYRTKSATCAPYINFMNKYKLQSSATSPIDTSYREKWVRYVRISPTATTGTPQITGLIRVYVIDGESGEDRIAGKVPSISVNVRNSTDPQYGDANIVNRKNNLEALTKPDSGYSFSSFPTKSGAGYYTPVTISDVWLEYDLMDEYPIERVIIEPPSASVSVTFFTSSRAVVQNPTASITFSGPTPSYTSSWSPSPRLLSPVVATTTRGIRYIRLANGSGPTNSMGTLTLSGLSPLPTGLTNLAVDRAGNVYALKPGAIYKITGQTGATAGAITGVLNTGSTTTSGLAINRVGNVYMADSGSHLIQITSPITKIATAAANLQVLLQARNYTSGNTWNDESGNGRNATLGSGTAQKNSSGNGIVLNGSTYWTFPNVAVGNSWSIGVWYKKTGGVVNNSAILTQGLNGGKINLFLGYLNSNLSISSYNNNWYTSSNNISLTDNQWTNIQVTWNGTNLVTYVNGSILGTVQPGMTFYDANFSYYIGKRWDGTTDFVIGEIGEVRIYNIALSSDQVNSVYNEYNINDFGYSLLVGTATSSGFIDGRATNTKFNGPIGTVVDANGNTYVADTGNNAIRMINPYGITRTLASGLITPRGVAINNVTNMLYITDSNAVRTATTNTDLYTAYTLITGLMSSSPVSTTNLQVLLRAKNYSGTGNWTDESGNSKHAIIAGGINQKNAAGNGIVLNGSTYWTFPGLPGVVNAWTANVWFKQTVANVGNYPCILTQQYTSSGNDMNLGIRASAANSTSYQAWIYKYPNAWHTINQTTTLQLGVWTNIQITWNGSVMTTYINGSSIGTTTVTLSTPLVSQNIPYNIGKRWDILSNTGNEYVTGEIGEVRIYNTTLTAAQVLSAYNESLPDFSNPQPTYFSNPQSPCIDPTTGDLYMTEASRILKVTGITRTLPANTMTGTVQTLPIGTPATNGPYALTVTPTGTLIVANSINRNLKSYTAASSVLDYTVGRVTTVAGDGTTAQLNAPAAVAVDSNGNIFITDTNNHCIRMVTPGGAVFVIAGAVGTAAFVDGSGANARFNTPGGIAVDSNGNVYVSDTNNNRIRKLTNNSGTWTISTFAGIGNTGSVAAATGGTQFADGAGTTVAKFNLPLGICIDSNDNIYVADNWNYRIRMITPAGVVSTIAGNGTKGTADGIGTAATFNAPTGVAVDSNFNVYVADFNGLIRKITPSSAGWTVSTLAGGSGNAYLDGAGSVARFNIAWGVSVDSCNNVYVTDRDNHRIRKITPGGVVMTLAGSGTAAFANGIGVGSTFNAPKCICTDKSNNLYVADTGNHRIRKIVTDSANDITNVRLPLTDSALVPIGSVTTLSTTYIFPLFITFDPAGNMYVSGRGAHTIDKVTPEGVFSVHAGSGAAASTNGVGAAASFNMPSGLAIDSDNNIYVADMNNHCIRKIDSTRNVTTVAGSGTAGNVDATGVAAQLNFPSGLVFDSLGNLFFSERATSTSHRIRMMATNGAVTTIAGGGTSGDVDNVGTTARFFHPTGLAFDSFGNLYIADMSNHRIRMITAATVRTTNGGVVTTFAGSGTAGSADGTGTSATFNDPAGICIDVNNNIYVGDRSNHRIRMITPAGVVTTIAGNGTAATVDGISLNAQFNQPYGVAIDPTGQFLCVGGNTTTSKIRKITIGSIIGWGITTYLGNIVSPVVDNNGCTYMATQGQMNGYYIYETTPGGFTYPIAGWNSTGTPEYTNNTTYANLTCYKKINGLAVTASGDIYVAETDNHCIRVLRPTLAAYAIWTYVGNRTVFPSPVNLSTPRNVAIDPDYNLYVIDGGNSCIRKISANGTTSTLLTGLNSFGITYDKTRQLLFVTELVNHCISSIHPTTGIKTVIAGLSGTLGSTDGTTAARFNGPAGIGVDTQGNLYVVDQQNNTIRRLTQSGSTWTTTTIVGSAAVTNTNLDGIGTAARLWNPYQIAVATNGDLYVACNNAEYTAASRSRCIKKITSGSWVVSTYFTFTGGITGNATNDLRASGITVDSSNNLFISAVGSNGHYMYRITNREDGYVIAGGTTTFGDGYNGGIDLPHGLCLDPYGNIFVAAMSNHAIRILVPRYMSSVLAGNGAPAFADGAGVAARFNRPNSIALDRSGNLIVADTGNNRIRKVTPAGNVTTIGGTGAATSTGDAGLATAATFNAPTSVSIDWSGAMYVTENSSKIRVLYPNYDVNVLAGQVAATASGVNPDGIGAAATFNTPTQVAWDNTNQFLYVGDTGNNRVRRVSPSGSVTTVYTSTNPLGGITVDSSGLIYALDGGATIRTIRPNPLTVNQIVALDSNGVNVAYNRPVKTFSNPQLAFRVVSGSDAIPYTSAGASSAEYLEIDLQQDYEITQVTYVGGGAASGTQLLLYDAALNQQDSRTIGPSGSIQTFDFRYAASGTGMKFAPLLLTDSSKYMPDSSIAGYVRGQYIVFENNSAGNKTITPPVIYDIYGKKLGTGITTTDLTALTTYGFKWELDLGQEYCIRDIQNTNNASIAIYNRVKAEVWRNYITNTITAPFLPQIPITSGASSYPIRFVRISATPAGTVTTMSLTPSSTTFNQSQYLTVDPAGNIYISEWGGHKISKITPDGIITLLAGSGTGGFTNGVGAAAQFRNPCGLAIRGEFLYVADQSNHCIRRIKISGTGGTIGDVTTIVAADCVYDTNNGYNGSGYYHNQFPAINMIQILVGGATNLPVAGMSITGNYVPPGTTVTSASVSSESPHPFVRAYTITISNNLTNGGSGVIATTYRYTFRDITLQVFLRAKNYTSGNTWNDESNKGRNASLAGGTATKNAAGNGIVLNGSTYWTIPALTMGNSWTANVWYKQTGANVGTYPSILTHQFVAPYQDINISIAANGSNGFRGQIFKYAASSVWYNSGQNMTLVNNMWTNIQITWNGSNMVTYVNGVQIGTTSLSLVSALGTNTQLLNIGKRHDLAEYVTGEIGEVRVYNRALTAAEVLTAYNESAIDFISNPVGLAFDSSGNLFFSEHANGNRIKMLNMDTRVVTTIAGSESAAFANGTGVSASFNTPTGIAFDSTGNLYIADQGNHRIRMITAATVRTTNGGVVTTFAGNGTEAHVDATGVSASFKNPCGLCIDTNNNLYVGDQMNHRVRMITPAGAVSTVAGNGTAGSVDGVGPNAQINKAYGVALDPTGKFIYVSQFVSGATLRRVLTPYTVPGINHVSVIDNRGVDVAVWKMVRRVSGTTVSFDAFNGTYNRPITITSGVSDRIEIDLGLAYNVTQIVVYYAGTSVPVGTNVITYNATGVQNMGVPVNITNTVNALTTYKSNGLRARYLSVTVPSGSANIHNMAVIDSLGRNVYTSSDIPNNYRTNMASFGQVVTEFDLGKEYNILYVVIYNKFTGSVSTIINPTVETTLTGASIRFLDAYRNIMTTRQITGIAGVVYPIGTPISAVYLTPIDPNIIITPGTPPTWTFPYTEKVVVTYSNATQSGSEGEKQIHGITGYVDSGGKKMIFFTTNQYIYKLYDGGLTQVYNAAGGGLRGIAISADRSILYVCNSSTNTIGSLSAISTATWTTIAGGGTAIKGSGCGLNSVDGSVTRTATQCTFNSPTGIAIDSSDNLYVADTNNHLIRKLVKSGTTWTVSTYAGGTTCTGVAGEDGNSRYKIADWESCAEGRWRSDYDWGAAGRWCTVDTNYRQINIISGADNGQSTAARFNSPKGISMGSDGKLYVADVGNSMVRVIDTSQNVTTLITGANSLIHVTNFSGDVYFSRNSMQLSVRGSTGVENIWSEYGTSYRGSGSTANTDGFLVKSAPSDIPPSSWTWPGIAANVIEAGLPALTDIQGNIGNIGPFIFLGGTLIFVETFIQTTAGSTTYIYKIRRTYENTTRKITIPARSNSGTGTNTYTYSSQNYFIPDMPFVGPFTASVVSPATNSNAVSAITNNTFIAQITTEIIDISMPPPVTGLYFISINSTSIAIGWTSGGDSTTSYTFTLNGAAVEPTLIGMTATFNNLTPDTLLYTIGVYTSNTNGSSFPATITSYPDTTVPQLYVLSATSTSITVQWTGGDFTNYYTYRLNAQSLNPTVDNSKTNKTVIFTRDATNTPLVGNTQYHINVISNRNTGRNFSSSTLIVTTAPVMPVLSFISINQTLSWSGGDGATSYRVLRNEVDVTSNATIDVVGKTIRFTGANALLGNTVYTFILTATSANGSSESDPLTITTPPVAVILTVTSIAANSVTVSWTGGDGASSYRFFIYLNSGSNTAYPNPFGKIQGINVLGEGGIIDVTTVAFCPDPVFLVQDGVNVRAISAGSANPRYFLGTLGNFRSDLYVAALSSSPYSVDTGTTFATALTNNFTAPYPTITQTGSSITITNMLANSKYTIGVIAINSNGETLATADNVKTDGTSIATYLTPATMTVPSAIGSLTSSNITQSTFKIAYTGGDTATSLTISITLNGVSVSGGYGSLYTYNVFRREIAFFNLNSSNTYVVTVRATNSAGPSTPSTTNITTSGITVAITTSSITYNSATIQWTPVPGASSYKYTYSSNPDTNCTSPFTLSSLTAGTSYTITVKAYNSSNVQIGIGNTTFITGPDMPNVSQSATKAPTSITVNWSSAPSTTSYPTSGYVFTLNGATVTPTIAGTSATFSNLAPGSSYIVTMKYSSTGNTGTLNNAFTSPVQPTITGSSISNITANSFTVTWTACAGAASYRINYGSGLSTNVNSATTTQAIISLTSNTSYSVNVVAISSNSVENPSATISVLTAPVAPTGLTVSAYTTSYGCTLSWTCPGGAASYTISGFNTTITGVTTTSCVVTGQGAGQTYSNVTVTAINATASVASVPLSVRMIPGPIATPTVSGISQTGCNVSWGAVTGAGLGTTNAYEYSLNGGTSWTGTTINSATISGQAAGTTITVTVRALNSSGSSTSTPIECILLPTTPTVLLPDYGSSNWSIASATKFKVSYTGGGETSWKITINGADVASNLTPGTTYDANYPGLTEYTTNTFTVSVTTRNASGNSPSSAAVTTYKPPQNFSFKVNGTRECTNWVLGSCWEHKDRYSIYLDPAPVFATKVMVYPTNESDLPPGSTSGVFKWNTKFSINPPGGSAWTRNIIGPNNEGPILSSAKRYLDDDTWDSGSSGHEYFRARAYNRNGVYVNSSGTTGDQYIKTTARADISVSKFNFTTGNLSQ